MIINDYKFAILAMKWFNLPKQAESIAEIKKLSQPELVAFVLAFQYECKMREEDSLVLTRELARSLCVVEQPITNRENPEHVQLKHVIPRLE